MMIGSHLRRDVKALVRSVSPPAVVRWREAAYFRRYGEPELRLVRPLCDAGRGSIDVGANLGAYVHFMRRWSKRVVAFEPVPWLARQLARKFPSRVVVRECALSDTNGTAILHVPLTHGEANHGLSSLHRIAGSAATEGLEIEVSTSRLDDICGDDVGFIKIDVEGHERAVLDGAVKTIERCRPNILVEIEERFTPNGVAQTRDLFAALDYKGFFVDRGLLKEVENFRVQSMQRAEDIAGFGPGVERMRFAGYVNNFIFVPHRRVSSTTAQIDAVLRKEWAGMVAGLAR